MAPKKTAGGSAASAGEANGNSSTGGGTKRKADGSGAAATALNSANATAASSISTGGGSNKKKKSTGVQKTLQAALSGECDTVALLKYLHEDIAEVRQQQAAEAAAAAVAATAGPSTTTVTDHQEQQEGAQAEEQPDDGGSNKPPTTRRQREAATTAAASHLESFLIGHKVDLFNAAGEMKSGRILRYDATKDQHFIALESTGARKWVTLREESARVSLEVIWGRIYGAPWWPGEVWCHTRKFLGGERPYPLVEGKLLVVFFAGNTHGWINPTGNLVGQIRLLVEEVDGEMIKKLENKRFAKDRAKIELALQEGKKEQERIFELQDRAVAEAMKEGAAGTAGGMGGGGGGGKVAVKRPPRGMEWQGRFFKLFSKKINYPTGGWLTGSVRLYSRKSKLHLVVYDDTGKAPEWCDFAKSVVEELSQGDIAGVRQATMKPRALTMTRGHDQLMMDEAKAEAEAAKPKCVNCQTPRDFEEMVGCVLCSALYHPLCVDLARSKPGGRHCTAPGGGWICPSCVCCQGCGAKERDLALAAESNSGSSSSSSSSGSYLEEVKLDAHRGVLACGTCLVKYNKKEFCPSCAQPWYAQPDETMEEEEILHLRQQEQQEEQQEHHHHHQQEVLVKIEVEKMREEKTLSRQERGEQQQPQAKQEEKEREPHKAASPSPPPRLVRASSPQSQAAAAAQWREEDRRMLKCDRPGCPLWVHARCERLPPEEYDAMINPSKPHTLCIEFFCPGCRPEALKPLLSLLVSEDQLLLFAEPVTEEIAPTYFEVIRRPMDLTTMANKLSRGEYRNAQGLRDDLELMARNALTFNATNSKYWKESLRFFRAAVSKLQAAAPDKTRPSHWAKDIIELVNNGKRGGRGEGGQERSRRCLRRIYSCCDSRSNNEHRHCNSK